MVELLENRFYIEAKKQDRGGVYALTQIKLAYNSNRIEGSTLTEKQTASIFETGTIRADGSFDSKHQVDVEEAEWIIVRNTHEGIVTQEDLTGECQYEKRGAGEEKESCQ